MFPNKFCQSSFSDNGSSSLKAVDIGFDFDVKKSIDPRIQENLESCIITSLNMSWDDVIGLDEVKRGLKVSNFCLKFIFLRAGTNCFLMCFTFLILLFV